MAGAAVRPKTTGLVPPIATSSGKPHHRSNKAAIKPPVIAGIHKPAAASTLSSNKSTNKKIGATGRSKSKSRVKADDPSSAPDQQQQQPQSGGGGAINRRRSVTALAAASATTTALTVLAATNVMATTAAPTRSRSFLNSNFFDCGQVKELWSIVMGLEPTISG